MLAALYSLMMTVFAVVGVVAAFRGAFGEARTERWMVLVIKNRTVRAIVTRLLFTIFLLFCVVGFQELGRWSFATETDPFLKVWVVAINACALFTVGGITAFIAMTWPEIKKRLGEDPPEEIDMSIYESGQLGDPNRTVEVIEKDAAEFNRQVGNLQNKQFEPIGPFVRDSAGNFVVSMKRTQEYKNFVASIVKKHNSSSS